MRKKILKFICVFTVIIVTFSCCFITSATETVDGEYSGIVTPTVTTSSIDYGFLNYGVPYYESWQGLREGYVSYFSPFFETDGIGDDGSTDANAFVTNSYYGYSASAIFHSDYNSAFWSNCLYRTVWSISFSKPIYKATFRVYLGSNVKFLGDQPCVVQSFGDDDLAFWQQTQQDNYLVFSIYNVEEPVKLFLNFQCSNGDVEAVGINISLAELFYSDGSAEQIANDNANADKIISGIDKSTDEVIKNQEENTDKILNGDEDLDSSGQTDKVDGTIGGIDGATSDAMGGKTDEEVQAEVESSLDTDKIGLDFNKANRISSFFDNLLNAFGSSYKALLLLSLSLGLAAFLIGRRYG